MSWGCQSGQHKTQLEVLPCSELVVACFWPQNHKKRLKMGHFRTKTRSNSGQQCILPRVNLDQMQCLCKYFWPIWSPHSPFQPFGACIDTSQALFCTPTMPSESYHALTCLTTEEVPCPTRSTHSDTMDGTYLRSNYFNLCPEVGTVLSKPPQEATTTLHSCRTLVLGSDTAFPLYCNVDWTILHVEGLVVLSGRQVTVVQDNKKEAGFMDFFNKAPIALHWLSSTGHVLWANEAEMNVLGYTAEEYIGQPIMKFCPDEPELVLKILKQLGSSKAIKDVPVRFRTKSGAIKHLLIDVGWTTDGSFGHLRDDTAHKIREALKAEASAHRETLRQNDLFIRKICHEIRTPCHLQSAVLQLIAEQLPLEGEAAKQLEVAMTQSVHLANLIEDMQWAMLFHEGKAPTLPLVDFDVRGVVHNVVTFVQTMFAHSQKQVSLHVHFCNSVPCMPISGYSTGLSRVLAHLLMNGMKFTRLGSVTLLVSYRSPGGEADMASGQVSISVKSTSPRIAENDIPALWQKYWQGSPARGDGSSSSSYLVETATDGLGLGLNVAFNLVQLMGSELKVKSTDEMTTFWFDLPASCVPDDLLSSFCTDPTSSTSRTSAGPPDRTRSSGPEAIHDVPLTDLLPHPPTDVPVPDGDAPPSACRHPPPATEHRGKSLGRNLRGFLVPWRHRSTSSAGGGRVPFRTPTAPCDSQQPRARRETTGTAEEPWAPIMQAAPAQVFVTRAPVRQQQVAPVQTTTPTRTLNPLAGPGPQPQGHVLVVDDSTICQVVLKTALAGLGYTADCADNGKIACDKVREHPLIYDCVFMDLRMPVMDGFEAVKYIRTQLHATMPIIVLSAECGEGIAEQVMKAGSSEFCQKPLQKAALRPVLQKHNVGRSRSVPHRSSPRPIWPGNPDGGPEK